MTTATLEPTAPPQAQEGANADIVLPGVTWNTYKRLADELEDVRVFMTFDGESLEIMTTSNRHERIKMLLHDLITSYAMEREIPIACSGSATMQRGDLKRAVEPDDCFYLKHEQMIRGHDSFDFTGLPAPELVVEIEISRRVSKRKEIYAEMGVPELWLYDGGSLRVLHLEKRAYHSADNSLMFPGLSLTDLERFLRMYPATSEYEIVKAFQAWVRALPKQA